MRPLPLLLASALAFGFAAADPPDRFVFESSSRVWIEGTSTVHDWDCAVERFSGSLNADATGGRFTALSGATFTALVGGIDCDNGTMNGKLRDALEIDSHPSVQFALTDASVGQAGADGWFDVAARGRLTVAGATRQIRVPVRAKALGADRFRLTGQVSFPMTEFGIDPPTAMLGALKTGDRVTVHFDATVRR
jgi:polyisoprenoid-binding protein YceI